MRLWLLLGVLTGFKAMAAQVCQPITMSYSSPSPNPIIRHLNGPDTRARKLIEDAQNQHIPEPGRATSAVWAILREYYPRELSKVASVHYELENPGLSVSTVRAGSIIQGKLVVGRYFLEQLKTHGFARRVLQVGHELRHIDQWRQGWVGEQYALEREFLAFYWEATTVEFPGTGRVAPTTRIKLIDSALAYLKRMPPDDQRKYRGMEAFLQRVRKQYECRAIHP